MFQLKIQHHNNLVTYIGTPAPQQSNLMSITHDLNALFEGQGIKYRAYIDIADSEVETCN